jgi:hypothetical protein
MSVLVKGVDFSTGDQVTAANLDALVDSATFASGAVDNSTTQLSGGAIIVKDGGIISAKLDTNIAILGTFSAGGGISSTTMSATGVISTTATGVVFTTGALTTSAKYASFANTAGTAEFGVQASGHGYAGTTSADDFDIYVNGVIVGTYSPTGLAVTGALSATGVLTLGSGSTIVSDSAGKILSAALNTVAVANGGTGATSAANARTNLGLVIGTNVAPATSGTSILYANGSGGFSSLTIGANLSFNGTTLSASGGGGGTIGGSTGSTDNRILRADGTGGSTVQASGITIDDSDNMTGAATYDAGTGGYKVSGTKVIGAQATAEADISLETSLTGSDSVNIFDLQQNFALTNAKINAILAKLRTHGLFAT